jgi:signal transduction histidine kinase
MSEPGTSEDIMATLSAEGEGPRALIVDDNEALLVICARALASQGYRVEAAQDGAAALSALRRTSFDVLVSDIHMPGMSGVELLEQLRSDGLDIPVVLVTGEPSLESAMKAMQHGVLRYLAKPVVPSALVAVVNEVVRLRGIARVRRLALDNEALQSLVEELRRSKDAALAGTRAKTEFLSKMGHELRAPMSEVIGMTTLALGTELTQTGRDCLESARAAADALMETISHVLDFADLDDGKLQLEVKPFSVRDTIKVTSEAMRPLAEKKRLSLTCDIATTVPDALVGDTARFGLILKTLVGNAVKFTQAGDVKINAHLEPHGGADVRLCVSISDTGIGIPPDALAQVAEAFAQHDNSPTRPYGGAGLGLTIASQLVALMKGSLTIDSTPGVGTTVRFTVSLERVVAQEDEGAGFFMLNSHARPTLR